MNDILERLERIEAAIFTLIQQRQVQDWYDTNTVAEILDASPLTASANGAVWEGCAQRKGRVDEATQRNG